MSYFIVLKSFSIRGSIWPERGVNITGISNIKAKILTKVVNEKLNDGLDMDVDIAISYDENLTSFFRAKGTDNSTSKVALGTGNEKESIKTDQLNGQAYIKRDLYYETTVENIRNLVIAHEVEGHGINKIKGGNNVHYQCYELQISKPQFKNTTSNYQAFFLSETYRYYLKAGRDLTKTKYKNMFYNKGGYKEYMKYYNASLKK